MVRYKLIDTHAHMTDPAFDPDRRTVIDRAERSGVAAIISVCEDMEHAPKNLALADRYDLLKPAFGLHPANLDIQQAESTVSFIRNNKEKLAAIGEVGLDYWLIKEEARREIQREILKKFVLLAKELDLPLNIHSRSAGRHTIKLLIENNAPKIQLHAFDGKASYALAAAEAGYYFSIPPSIIRSRQKQKLAAKLPLTSLLLESDSPALGPDPKKRNVPANIVLALNAVSEIKNVVPAAAAETILENTRRLYSHLGI